MLKRPLFIGKVDSIDVWGCHFVLFVHLLIFGGLVGGAWLVRNGDRLPSKIILSALGGLAAFALLTSRQLW